MDIREFNKEFLDYYGLDNLIINVYDKGYKRPHIHIAQKDYKPFNISEFKDSLTSFLLSFINEFEVVRDPVLMYVFSKVDSKSVKTCFFNMKGFSETRFSEKIDYIQLYLK
jgi:hypothetical protein